MVDFVFLYHPHIYETVPSAQIGLGILSVATYARDLGASVRVINAQAETVERAIKLIPPCDYLCFYGCLVDTDIINAIAKAAKLRRLCNHVIVGGPIGKSPRYLQAPAVDIVHDGPGEPFIWRLLHGWISACSSNYAPSFYGSIPKLCSEWALEDIEKYPFPDRTLVKGPLGGRIFVRSDEEEEEQSTTILMSRGCRHRCAFCSSANGSQPQSYSLERIEAELDHCISLGLRNIRVSDDNIMDDPQRLKSICRLLRDRSIKWRGSLRVTNHDVELYRLMARSGCEELSFGVESGDQEVLNALRKGTKVCHNTEAVQNAKKAGIKVVRALMMMATPGESRKTLKQNKAWVRQARPDIVSLKVFVPYPGTDIFDSPAKYSCKLLHRSDHNNSSYRPDDSLPAANIYLPGKMTAEELTQQFLEMRSWLEHYGIENRG